MAPSFDPTQRATAERRPAAVVFHVCHASAGPLGHDPTTKRAVTRSIAELLGVPFAGDLDVLNPVPGALVVPSDTVEGLDEARRLGITEAGLLFGGVVPYPFVASKVITHPLVKAGAPAPAGWSAAFGDAVKGVVLPGYSAFTRDDALVAGERLLAGGSVRVKDPAGVGGAGQAVAASRAELATLIDAFEPASLQRDGLVLERNLLDVTTYSVGFVRLGDWEIAYCGTQGLTRNHHGASVYGGSQLTIARGGEAALLALPLGTKQRAAVEQATVYHRSAFKAYPGLMASRCNYDVVSGLDEAGQRQTGVLEQSWRIGGASGAEIAAMHAFRADPALQTVNASTFEVYGEPASVPSDAHLHFDGIDARAGRLVKYAVVEPFIEMRTDPHVHP